MSSTEIISNCIPRQEDADLEAQLDSALTPPQDRSRSPKETQPAGPESRGHPAAELARASGISSPSEAQRQSPSTSISPEEVYYPLDPEAVGLDVPRLEDPLLVNLRAWAVQRSKALFPDDPDALVLPADAFLASRMIFEAQHYDSHVKLTDPIVIRAIRQGQTRDANGLSLPSLDGSLPDVLHVQKWTLLDLEAMSLDINGILFPHERNRMQYRTQTAGETRALAAELRALHPEMEFDAAAEARFAQWRFLTRPLVVLERVDGIPYVKVYEMAVPPEALAVLDEYRTTLDEIATLSNVVPIDEYFAPGAPSLEGERHVLTDVSRPDINARVHDVLRTARALQHPVFLRAVWLGVTSDNVETTRSFLVAEPAHAVEIGPFRRETAFYLPATMTIHTTFNSIPSVTTRFLQGPPVSWVMAVEQTQAQDGRLVGVPPTLLPATETYNRLPHVDSNAAAGQTQARRVFHEYKTGEIAVVVEGGSSEWRALIRTAVLTESQETLFLGAENDIRPIMHAVDRSGAFPRGSGREAPIPVEGQGAGFGRAPSPRTPMPAEMSEPEGPEQGVWGLSGDNGLLRRQRRPLASAQSGGKPPEGPERVLLEVPGLLAAPARRMETLDEQMPMTRVRLRVATRFFPGPTSQDPPGLVWTPRTTETLLLVLNTTSLLLRGEVEKTFERTTTGGETLDAFHKFVVESVREVAPYDWTLGSVPETVDMIGTARQPFLSPQAAIYYSRGLRRTVLIDRRDELVPSAATVTEQYVFQLLVDSVNGRVAFETALYAFSFGDADKRVLMLCDDWRVLLTRVSVPPPTRRITGPETSAGQLAVTRTWLLPTGRVEMGPEADAETARQLVLRGTPLEVTVTVGDGAQTKTETLRAVLLQTPIVPETSVYMMSLVEGMIGTEVALPVELGVRDRSPQTRELQARLIPSTRMLRTPTPRERSRSRRRRDDAESALLVRDSSDTRSSLGLLMRGRARRADPAPERDVRALVYQNLRLRVPVVTDEVPLPRRIREIVLSRTEADGDGAPDVDAERRRREDETTQVEAHRLRFSVPRRKRLPFPL